MAFERELHRAASGEEGLDLEREKAARLKKKRELERAARTPGKRTLVEQLPAPPAPPESVLEYRARGMRDVVSAMGAIGRGERAGLLDANAATSETMMRVADRRAHTLMRRAQDHGDVDAHDPAVEESLAQMGGGTPLPEKLRKKMETEFGVSFDRVRVHTDGVAAQAAAAVHAEAFTVGEDIFFAEGAFDPTSKSGQHLIAHELTHVVQGMEGRVAAAGGVSKPGESLETEAERRAEKVVARGSTPRVAPARPQVEAVRPQVEAPRAPRTVVVSPAPAAAAPGVHAAPIMRRPAAGAAPNKKGKGKGKITVQATRDPNDKIPHIQHEGRAKLDEAKSRLNQATHGAKAHANNAIAQAHSAASTPKHAASPGDEHKDLAHAAHKGHEHANKAHHAPHQAAHHDEAKHGDKNAGTGGIKLKPVGDWEKLAPPALPDQDEREKKKILGLVKHKVEKDRAKSAKLLSSLKAAQLKASSGIAAMKGGLQSEIAGAQKAALGKVSSAEAAQVASVQSHIAGLQAQVRGAASAAVASVDQAHQQTIAQMAQAFAQANQKLAQDHTTALSKLQADTTAEVTAVSTQFEEAESSIRAYGGQKASEASAMGDMALSYSGDQLDAARKAAHEVAAKYAAAMPENANQAAEQVGKSLPDAQDAVRHTSDAFKEQIDTAFNQAKDALQTQHQQMVQAANQAHQQSVSSIRQASSAAISALGALQSQTVAGLHSQAASARSSISSAGAAAIAGVGSTCDKAAAGLKGGAEGVIQAAAKMETPDPKHLGLEVAKARKELSKGAAAAASGMKKSASSSAASLAQQATGAAGGLAQAASAANTSASQQAQAAEQGIRQTAQQATQAQHKIGEEFKKNSTKLVTQTQTGFEQANEHAKTAFEKQTTTLEGKLKGFVDGCKGKLDEAVPGKERPDILAQAAKAAASVPKHWWQKVVSFVVKVVIAVAIGVAVGALIVATGGVGGVLLAVAIGAAGGALGYTASLVAGNLIEGKAAFDNFSWKGLAVAAVAGGLTAGATSALGSLASGATSGFLGAFAEGASGLGNFAIKTATDFGISMVSDAIAQKAITGEYKVTLEDVLLTAATAGISNSTKLVGGAHGSEGGPEGGGGGGEADLGAGGGHGGEGGSNESAHAGGANDTAGAKGGADEAKSGGGGGETNAKGGANEGAANDNAGGGKGGADEAKAGANDNANAKGGGENKGGSNEKAGGGEKGGADEAKSGTNEKGGGENKSGSNEKGKSGGEDEKAGANDKSNSNEKGGNENKSSSKGGEDEKAGANDNANENKSNSNEKGSKGGEDEKAGANDKSNSNDKAANDNEKGKGGEDEKAGGDKSESNKKGEHEGNEDQKEGGSNEKGGEEGGKKKVFDKEKAHEKLDEALHPKTKGQKLEDVAKVGEKTSDVLKDKGREDAEEKKKEKEEEEKSEKETEEHSHPEMPELEISEKELEEDGYAAANPSTFARAVGTIASGRAPDLKELRDTQANREGRAELEKLLSNPNMSPEQKQKLQSDLAARLNNGVPSGNIKRELAAIREQEKREGKADETKSTDDEDPLGSSGAPVQRKATGPAPAGGVQAAAAQGTQGTGGRLPHLDQIQRSFGSHDVSGVQAHVGGAAATASAQLGAEAYAHGNSVAFAGQPDLHTAAHEAAHVVQQRGGVQLKGGIDGGASDPYEQHADAVADAVVAGKSAEPLLRSVSGTKSGTTAAAAVQRKSSVPDPLNPENKHGATYSQTLGKFTIFGAEAKATFKFDFYEKDSGSLSGKKGPASAGLGASAKSVQFGPELVAKIQTSLAKGSLELISSGVLPEPLSSLPLSVKVDSSLLEASLSTKKVDLKLLTISVRLEGNVSKLLSDDVANHLDVKASVGIDIELTPEIVKDITKLAEEEHAIERDTAVARKIAAKEKELAHWKKVGDSRAELNKLEDGAYRNRAIGRAESAAAEIREIESELNKLRGLRGKTAQLRAAAEKAAEAVGKRLEGTALGRVAKKFVGKLFATALHKILPIYNALTTMEDLYDATKFLAGLDWDSIGTKLVEGGQAGTTLGDGRDKDGPEGPGGTVADGTAENKFGDADAIQRDIDAEEHPQLSSAAKAIVDSLEVKADKSKPGAHTLSANDLESISAIVPDDLTAEEIKLVSEQVNASGADPQGTVEAVIAAVQRIRPFGEKQVGAAAKPFGPETKPFGPEQRPETSAPSRDNAKAHAKASPKTSHVGATSSVVDLAPVLAQVISIEPSTRKPSYPANVTVGDATFTIQHVKTGYLMASQESAPTFLAEVQVSVANQPAGRLKFPDGTLIDRGTQYTVAVQIKGAPSGQ